MRANSKGWEGGTKQETEGQSENQDKGGEGECKTGGGKLNPFQRPLYCRDKYLKGRQGGIPKVKTVTADHGEGSWDTM